MSKLRPTVIEVFLTEHNQSEQIDYENAFFSNILLENKVKKTTYPNRLDDLNEIVSHLLPSRHPLELMDVAISSGISTIEWSNSLKSKGVKHNIIAGDVVIDAYLISISKYINILATASHYPIQYDVFKLPITNASGRLMAQVLRLLMKNVYEIVMMIHPQIRKNTMIKYEGKYGIKCQPIKLVSRILTEMKHIEIIEDNIITNADQTLLNRFDAIRAANVLNPRCFTSELIMIILRNLGERLKDGGLLIECRTDENNINNGSIYRINLDRQYELVDRIGSGSEIEHLILQTKSSEIQ